MGKAALRQFSAILALLVTTAATADIVKLKDKPPFRSVTITDFRDQRLVFRGVSREYLRKPLSEVAWIAVDGRADLNRAEQLRAEREWAEAADYYRRILDGSQEGWALKFARVRLLEASRQMAKFDQAVDTWIAVISANPSEIESYDPGPPGERGSAQNRRARTLLETASESAESPRVVQALRTLLLELLLYEDVTPLPPAFAASPATTRPATATQPASESGLGILSLPDGGGREVRPERAPPADERLPIRLDDRSLVLEAAECALGQDDVARAERLVERGLPFVDPHQRVPWLIVANRCRIARGAPANAAAELMRITHESNDPAHAAQALYYVGVAHEELGRPDVARDIYRDLLEDVGADERLRARARAGLDRTTSATTQPTDEAKSVSTP